MLGDYGGLQIKNCYFLIKLTINNNNQAPQAAISICQSKPPPPIPNFPAR